MNETRNPYSPPLARVEDPVPPTPEAEALIENGRRVPIDSCVRWLSGTFRLFFQRPWKWIGSMLLLLLLWLVLSIIPYFNLLSSFLSPVMAGGLASAIDVQRRTSSFTLGDVFAGFGPRFLQLAAVGFVGLFVHAIMFALFFVMSGSEAAIAMVLGAKQLDTLPPNFWSVLALATLLALPFTAATYLATPLIMLHGLSPIRAMKMSLLGSFKNIVPWILFGILVLVVIALSIIPLLLGLFVTLPVSVMAFYVIYRDIFVAESGEKDGAAV